MTAKVKICGIKSEAALDAALEAGADYVGLVFFARSPRNLDVPEAAKLARRAHERGRARVVALLVDPEDELIDRVVAEVRPDFVQLHGSESPERVAVIRKRTGVPIIKALSVTTAEDVARAALYLAPGARADLILFDAKAPEGARSLPGGNGLTFDWHILEGVATRHPFALAGGLRQYNVAEAIRLTGASILDVSSGVEVAPGEKDPELIRRFLHAAKAAKH
jgi:phosphoribosylanthranilate isomerase